MALTIALIVGMIVVIVMAINETHHFRRNRSVYMFRRLTLRLCMATMLLFLFASILIGTNVQVFGLTDPVGIDLRWVAFWGCVLLLVGAICCLALADLAMIREDDSLIPHDIAEKHANYREEIEAIIAQHQKKGDE